MTYGYMIYGENLRCDCGHNSLNIQSNAMKFSQILPITVLNWVYWSKS